MIRTLPLKHTHRDKLRRLIRRGDILVWTNKKYGSGLTVAEVTGSTEKQVLVYRSDLQKETKLYPENCIVITHQVERNLEGNVGVNMDLEATR